MKMLYSQKKYNLAAMKNDNQRTKEEIAQQQAKLMEHMEIFEEDNKKAIASFKINLIDEAKFIADLTSVDELENVLEASILYKYVEVDKDQNFEYKIENLKGNISFADQLIRFTKIYFPLIFDIRKSQNDEEKDSEDEDVKKIS